MASPRNEITTEQFKAMKAAAPVAPSPLTVEAELKAARAGVALDDTWINPITRGYFTGDFTPAEVEHAKLVRYHEVRYEVTRPAGYPTFIERGRDKYECEPNWLVDRYVISLGNSGWATGHPSFPQFCIDLRLPSNWAQIERTSSDRIWHFIKKVRVELDRFPLELSPEQAKTDEFAVAMGMLMF